MIIGKLIPAGTGMPRYRDIATSAPDYEPLPFYSSDTDMESDLDLAAWLADTSASTRRRRGAGSAWPASATVIDDPGRGGSRESRRRRPTSTPSWATRPEAESMVRRPRVPTATAPVIAGAVAVVLAAAPAVAHVGGPTHGIADGAVHPLTGMDHLLARVAVGLIAVMCGRRVAVPGAFLLGMAVGGALGGAGVAFPGWSSPLSRR